MDLGYEIKYSKRKTLAITIKNDCSVLVSAPLDTPFCYIESFVQKNKVWIASKLERMKKHIEKYPLLNKDDMEKLRAEAKAYIPARVEYFAGKMNVMPSGVKITSARKRFGSCNQKNALCFSLYLMRYPKEAIDYVVVHELSHILEKNHGKGFYRIVESILPDYKERRKLLSV
ncbi:MAG: M48 family metallopeptidase [Ruminococcaceae bacterium]|nr:M48 family metallopeptidase [Oscillospiraceae bacterium]